jgi:hypothetical protein
MANLTSVAELHNWTRVNVKAAPEDELVEVTTWEPGQTVVRAEPSGRARYTTEGGWRREDGSAFAEGVEVCYWRPLGSGFSIERLFR